LHGCRLPQRRSPQRGLDMLGPLGDLAWVGTLSAAPILAADSRVPRSRSRSRRSCRWHAASRDSTPSLINRRDRTPPPMSIPPCWSRATDVCAAEDRRHRGMPRKTRRRGASTTADGGVHAVAVQAHGGDDW